MLYVATIVFVIACSYTVFKFGMEHNGLDELSDETILNIIVWLSLNVSLSPFSKFPIYFAIINSVILVTAIVYISMAITKYEWWKKYGQQLYPKIKEFYDGLDVE